MIDYFLRRTLIMSKAIKLEQLKLFAQKAKEDAQKAAGAVKVPAYTLSKLETAETGFLSSYQLTKDGVAIGDKINIPKDFLVKSAELKTADAADMPYTGAAVGDKYIDFVINSKDGSDTASHVYLPINDLVDTYTGGNGISIENYNVTVKIDATNANGLSVGGNGIALSLATTTAAGAMSAADKVKIDDLQFATDEEVNTMLAEVFADEPQAG